MDKLKSLAIHIFGSGFMRFMGCAAQQSMISEIRGDVAKVQGEPMLEHIFGFAHVREKNARNLKIVRAESERGCQINERGVSNFLSHLAVSSLRLDSLPPSPRIRSEYDQ